MQNIHSRCVCVLTFTLRLRICTCTCLFLIFAFDAFSAENSSYMRICRYIYWNDLCKFIRSHFSMIRSVRESKNARQLFGFCTKSFPLRGGIAEKNEFLMKANKLENGIYSAGGAVAAAAWLYIYHTPSVHLRCGIKTKRGKKIKWNHEF